jgi:dTDP-4-amino-4,6-dideoxygalactose transaminase
MISASLGAHYSSSFVRQSNRLFWQVLLGWPVKKTSADLKQRLEKEFGGEAALTYKGRDAIELALRAYGLTDPNSPILTQAFTCFAIEEAIVRAGSVPAYTDVEAKQLNLTVQTLQAAYKQHPTAKAVIVQHSLGHPADIKAIQAWCRKHNLLLIEDLAQSFGAATAGQLLGTFGDAVILSFGRDKVVDAVSGGAVIFRTPPTHSLPPLTLPPTGAVLKDLAYPFFTWLIRATYDIALGKIIHKLFTLAGLMTNPTQSPTQTFHRMPESLAILALRQLTELPDVKKHRHILAAEYLKQLTDTPLSFFTKEEHFQNGSLLRVAAAYSEPQKLLAFLKHRNIHLTDRWYRVPVDSGKLQQKTLYISSSCPNAEQRAATVMNLPTHPKISIREAEYIADSIKQFFAHHS